MSTKRILGAGSFGLPLLLCLLVCPAKSPGDEKKEGEKGVAEGAASGEKKAVPRDPSVGGLPGDPSKTGAIAGLVTFAKGAKKPELKGTPVPADHKDVSICGHEIPNERLVLGPQGGIANAIISLDKVPDAPKPSKRPILLDNVHCIFVPHVQATTAGSPLRIESEDDVLHSGMSLLTNTFNISVLKGSHVDRTLNRAGWMPVKCAAHGWMDAHIWVFPHDYFAVTGKEGKFKIEGIPPGKYTVKIWQEMLAPQSQELKREVTVEAGKSADLNVEMKPQE